MDWNKQTKYLQSSLKHRSDEWGSPSPISSTECLLAVSLYRHTHKDEANILEEILSILHVEEFKSKNFRDIIPDMDVCRAVSEDLVPCYHAFQIFRSSEETYEGIPSLIAFILKLEFA